MPSFSRRDGDNSEAVMCSSLSGLGAARELLSPARPARLAAAARAARMRRRPVGGGSDRLQLTGTVARSSQQHFYHNPPPHQPRSYYHAKEEDGEALDLSRFV
jgi:hypothetical protein